MADISNSNNNSLVVGTASDDTIINYGSTVTVNAYAGNDRVSVLSTANVTVSGDEGNDDIRILESSNIEVDAGADDDLVNLWSFSNIKVTMGSGNDTVELTGGSRATIITGDGDNYVTLINANNISIQTGNGTDLVRNNNTNTGGFYNTIDSGDGTDVIENRGYNVIINSGAGSDTITNVAVTMGVGGNNASINGGADDDYIYNGTNPYQVNGGDNVTIDGGDGNDTILNFSGIYSSYTSSALSAVINGGNGNDSINNYGGSATIDGGDGNDTIENRGANVSINGGADNDSINFITGTGTTINVSEGDNTVSIGNYNEVFVEGFGYGDVIQLGNKTSTLTSIDGGIVANYIIIRGVSAIAQDSNTWITSTNSITYQNISSSGASLLDDRTIIYSTVNSSVDEFTITGLSSTVGVSVDGLQVVLNASALDGVTGTISISGGSYVLALASDVDTPASTSGGWNSVGTNGRAIYSDAGTLAGWSLADDSKSVTFTEGSADSLLVLEGVAAGTSLADISDDGQVVLWAENFGSNGVTVASNPNGYVFNLSGDFDGKTFTGTANADTIFNNGNNISIDGGAGDDGITNYAENAFIDGGTGNDYIYMHEHMIWNDATETWDYVSSPDNVTINGGDGNDTISNNIYSYRAGSNVSINGGEGDDLIDNYGSNITIDGGARDDYIKTWEDTAINILVIGGAGDDSVDNHASNSTILGGDGNDLIENYGDYASIDAGDGDDYIEKGNNESHVTMNGGAGSDTIYNVGGEDISINGGAGNDSINLVSGSGATVNVSEGDDTISVGASVADFVVEGFGVGDVIILSETPDEITTIDGGIVAGNVTIMGISAATGGDNTWSTSGNTITYRSGRTAGASLDGNTITYSTVSSASDEFTITGLSSTVGVNVDNSQAVLNAAALAGASGTVSISGGDYVLSLDSDVETPVSTAGGWNSIGSDGTAIYSGSGISDGWSLADDSKSVTFAEGTADSVLVLEGVAAGTSLADISSGTVYLTADNFGSSGVTVASNPNGYVFNLSGDFNGNSSTGTASDDTITNEGSNVRIDGLAGNDSINLVSGTGATVNVGTGNNTIDLGAAISDLMVEGFGVGDVILLSETVDELTAIDGGIVAGNVTIGGISAVAQDGFGWTTDYNSITYQSALTAGASLDGGTITYSTVSSAVDGFTITGLSSTVGVSVDGLQVILSASALDGVTGTVSISGGDYVLSLDSDVEIPVSVAGAWDEVGSDGVAIYRGEGISDGWSLADDSKSVTFAEGSADSVLVLEGVAEGTSLTDISGGTVYLTADNFGANGVTVASNPNGYSFDLSGDFNGNSFTGTEGADNINSNGYNILINGVAGDDSITSNGENATVDGGEGNDVINITGNNNSLDGGAGDDYISLQSGLEVIISYTEGQGNDTVYGYSESVELQINAESGWESMTSGNDIIINVNEGSSITLVDAAGIEQEEEPEFINEELPGRVVFAGWGYGFTPREDSPLYGSPAPSEISASVKKFF